MQSYSIAEARDKFTTIVHAVEAASTIELTRRGEPVAMIVSIDEYRRLKDGKQDFWSAYTAFQQGCSSKAAATGATHGRA